MRHDTSRHDTIWNIYGRLKTRRSHEHLSGEPLSTDLLATGPTGLAVLLGFSVFPSTVAQTGNSRITRTGRHTFLSVSYSLCIARINLFLRRKSLFSGRELSTPGMWDLPALTAYKNQEWFMNRRHYVIKMKFHGTDTDTDTDNDTDFFADFRARIVARMSACPATSPFSLPRAGHARRSSPTCPPTYPTRALFLARILARMSVSDACVYTISYRVHVYKITR